MLNTNLTGKYFLVTGASSGIGEATVRRLSELGAIVVMVARNEKKMKQIASEVKGQTYVIPFDLTKTEEIVTIFDFIKKEGFKLDGLIHAAGISYTLPIRSTGIKEMKISMETHYYAFFELGKFFAKKQYSNDEGSIIALSSIASILCSKGQAEYSASKAAMNSLTKTMSKEFIKRRIRVNAIAPALVDTEMTKEVSRTSESFKMQPLGIIPTEQIVALIEFLLGDTSKYITGEIIAVSGGWFN